jgi:hypothetical protein
METRGADRDPHSDDAVRSRTDTADLAPGREISNASTASTTPASMPISPMPLSDFAHAARLLTVLCREVGLDAPGFRSPPRNPDVDRALLRRADGGAAVAVRLRGRDAEDVIDDMVAGVCALNKLAGRERAGWTLALGLMLRSRLSPPPRDVRATSTRRHVSASAPISPLHRPPSAA